MNNKKYLKGIFVFLIGLGAFDHAHAAYGQNQGYYAADHNDGIADKELLTRIRQRVGPGVEGRGYENVTVNVRNGIVTLEGRIKGQDRRLDLEKKIRDIQGVKGVDNRLIIENSGGYNYQSNGQQNGYQSYNQSGNAQRQYAANENHGDQGLTDRQLEKKIQDKIGPGWFTSGYENIVVTVSNGVVTLQGTVKNPEDKIKIEKEIQPIEGVLSISNQLTVEGANGGEGQYSEEEYLEEAQY